MRSTVWPIMKREYLSRILTKGFWISTALLPLFMAAIAILPSLLAIMSKASPEPILVVDLPGDFFPVLSDVMKSAKSGDNSPTVRLEPQAGRSIDELRRTLNDRSEKGEIQGYIIVDPKNVESGELIYAARNPSSAMGAGGITIESRLRQAITKYRLVRLGLTPDQVQKATKKVDLEVVKATNDPEKEESGASAFIASFMLVMFIYMALIFYGIYVLRGVLEEKSNRIVEVIVSSVKPFHLMIGKIVGIGCVGLTQIAIWVVFMLIFTAPQVGAALSISEEMMPKISGVTLAFFPVYFVLGYFLYATIYAGIGSMFNSDEDAQQMVGVANMFLIIPIMVIGAVMKNPSSGMSTALSLFPFFAPILMYLRIAVQTPPVWQIALSIAIMLVTIVLMIWIVSRIYRVGILMYGKRPTIPELVRWLRYT